MKKKLPFMMPQKVENIDEIASSLIGFYKSLGWDPEKSVLDVRKIHISEQDYKAVADMYMQIEDALETVPVLLVNYMPSVKGKVEQGFVVIEQGAF